MVDPEPLKLWETKLCIKNILLSFFLKDDFCLFMRERGKKENDLYRKNIPIIQFTPQMTVLAETSQEPGTHQIYHMGSKNPIASAVTAPCQGLLQVCWG